MKNFLERIPHETIVINGKKYLTRYYLLGREWKYPNLYLHHFHSSDLNDGKLHNHPFKCGVSLILKGGYREVAYQFLKNKIYLEKYSKFYPFQFNVIKDTIFHRVELLDEINGCWSIIFRTSRKFKPNGDTDWEFLDQETLKRIPWTESEGAIP